MDFIDSYKHLEKLCSDMLQSQYGVSAYIEEMVKAPRGSFFVKGWNEDLKHLKHYRWIRNQIVHNPGCSEKNMCEYGDAQWIGNFYDRIMNQTDPLAMYRRATVPRPVPKPAQNYHPVQQWRVPPTPVVPSPKSSKKAVGWTVGITIAVLIGLFFIFTYLAN